jgi:hypothetical protein
VSNKEESKRPVINIRSAECVEIVGSLALEKSGHLLVLQIMAVLGSGVFFESGGRPSF